ncbi:MAG TPA: NHL repeat-containing protein [Anaeromyxobacteraceae bacterium]|nr:NHL repeat-containing protein [Anaeromyxobacteraceae bacterium]
MALSIRAAVALCAVSMAMAARAGLTLTPGDPLYADAKGAALKEPEGVGCSESALVVADTGHGRLVAYEWKDGTLSGGTELKVSQVTYPVRVQLGAGGDIFVLDRKARRVAKLNHSGQFVGWVEPKNASGVIAGAFRVGPEDHLYLLDIAENAVVVLDANATVTRKLELPRGKGLFTDISVDGAGTIYALDSVGATVWSADKSASAFKPFTKSLKEAMSFPSYITPDGKGTLFVVDQNGNGIVLVGPDGTYLGRRLAIGWNTGLVYYPTQVCFLGTGALALADRSNNRIQVFVVTR